MPVWKEDYFSPDRTRNIFYRACFPEKAGAYVLIVHGYAEHSGRYKHVMEYLAGRGYASYAPDHRGHGRSARRLGDMDSFTGVVADLAAFKEFIRARAQGAPLFILGHSLGGCLTLCLAARHAAGVSGAVVIAPMILVPDFASPLLIAVSGVLAALAPRMPAQAFPIEHLSRDPAVITAALNDPHHYTGKMMARTGYQSLQGIKLARTLLKEITIPIILLHGGDDRVMKPEGSEYVLATVSSRDKTLKKFDHLYHEILNEPEKAGPLKVIGDWLDAHHASGS
jgi:acylglycerol lipase